MQASTVIAILSFTAAALAQSTANPFNVPPSGYNNIAAGKTVPLTWMPTTGGTVSLILRSGPTNNLNQGTPIVSNIPNSGSYTWSVPSSIVQGSDYAVEIVADNSPGETNFTPPFAIASSNTQSSSASSASMSMTSSASSSASRSSTAMSSSTSSSMSMSSMTSMSTSRASASSATMSSASAAMVTQSQKPNSAANRMGNVFADVGAVKAVVVGLMGVAVGMAML